LKLCRKVQKKVDCKHEDGGYTELGNRVSNELRSIANTASCLTDVTNSAAQPLHLKLGLDITL
jgi:hypothetical protein